MKKYLAIILAILMLCMAGCGVTVETGEVEETTVATTEEAPVLLSAEEYLTNALEKDLADTAAYQSANESGCISLGVDNVDYLLSLFAMNNLPIPAISNVRLDMAANAKNMLANYVLSAKVNGNDANVGFGVDLTSFDMVLFSNLFDDVIGIDYSAVTGIETANIAAISEFSNDFVNEYGKLFGEFIITSASTPVLTDNGTAVHITVTADGEAIFNFVETIVNALAEDEDAVKFFADFYDIDFAEIKAEFDLQAEEMKAEIVDSGVTVTLEFDIDKTTFDTCGATVTVTDGTETVVINAVEAEGTGTVEILYNEESVAKLAYVVKEDFFDASLVIKAESLDFAGSVNAENGSYALEANVVVSEYDWENGGYVDTEHNVSVSGTYSLEADKTTVTLGTVSYNGITIDFATAGIYFVYGAGEVDLTLPTATKDALALTELDTQLILLSVFEKLDIDPAMFAAGATATEF